MFYIQGKKTKVFVISSSLVTGVGTKEKKIGTWSN